MKRSSLSRVAAIMAVLAAPALAMPSLAFAQSTSATPAAAGGKTSQRHNVEAHIQALHDQLQITPAEEPQWAGFAQVMRDNAAQMSQAFQARGANMGTMNAVADMQSYAQLAQIQSENMQKLSSSFQALYNSFPASQQKIADGVFRAKIASHPKKGAKSVQP